MKKLEIVRPPEGTCRGADMGMGEKRRSVSLITASRYASGFAAFEEEVREACSLSWMGKEEGRESW